MIEMGEVGDAEAARFWRRVGRRSRHECWDWLAARTSVGYGSLRIRGVTRLAHRIAWARTFGPIPAGNVLRHTCHYRRCVNPWQLVPGTRRENNQDRARAWRGARKLTRCQVMQIKTRVAAGERQTALAREYGVHPTNINHIVNGRQGLYADQDGRPATGPTPRHPLGAAHDAGGRV